MEENELKTKIQHLETEIEDLEKELQNSIDVQETELKGRIGEKKIELTEHYILLGNIFLGKLDFENAKESFLKATQILPNDANAWNNLGLAFLNLKDYDEAKNAFEKAIELNPNAVLALYNLGFTFSILKDYKNAQITLEKAIEINPNDANAWNILGLTFSILKDYKNAQIALEKAIEINPNDANAWNILGIVFYALNENEEAKSAYEKAIELNPNLPEVWSNLGSVFYALKEYEKAKKSYEKVIELSSNHVDAWHNLGQVFYALKEYEKAKNACQKAIELSPNHVDAWHNLGQVFYALKEYEKAKKSYEKTIELSPNHAEAWNNLGPVFYALKEYEKAKKSYEKTIELSPNHVSAWNNLGLIFHTLKEYEKAKNACQKAIELSPNLVDAWNNLGLVFYALNENDKAKNAYEKAIELSPTQAKAQFGLGLVILRKKMYEKSLIAFQKVLEMDYSLKNIVYLCIAECHVGLANLEEAKINYEQANKFTHEDENSKDFQDIYKSFLHEYNNSLIKSSSENQSDFEAEILPFAVKRLAISDFQCIKNIDISLPADARFVFLLGQNGDGKTSILQALAIALHGAEGEAYQLLKENNQTKIGVEFLQVGKNTIHNLYHADKAWKGIDKCKQAAGYSVKRLNVTDLPHEEWGKIEPFDNLYTQNDEKLLNIERWLIDDYLDNEKVTTWAKEIFSVLKDLMPSVEKVERKRSGIIYFEFGRETTFRQLSAGNKAIVSMIGDMLIRLIETQRETAANLADLSGIVLVDEIESHLHPSAQRELVFRLSQILPKVQFWLTTHSVFPLLASPKNSVCLRVRRDVERGTYIERLDVDVTNLLPNQILTSSLFDVEILPTHHKNIAEIDTSDTFEGVVRRKELNEKLKSLSEKLKAKNDEKNK